MMEPSTTKNSDKSQILNIKITDFILTPLTCAVLINELIKSILYEKSQIPYPYVWLKHLARKKDCSVTDLKEDNKRQQCIDRHYRLVKNAYENLEQLMSSIRNLFLLGNEVCECVVLLGATPLCSKEAYVFKFPKLMRNHNEGYHLALMTKRKHTVFRSILLSKEWTETMQQSLPLTNMYTFFQMDSNTKMVTFNAKISEMFIPSQGYSLLSRNIHTFTINFLCDNEYTLECCRNIVVYQDNLTENSENDDDDDDDAVVDTKDELVNVIDDCNSNMYVENNCLQIVNAFQGFRENYINNEPISNLW